MKNLAAIPMLVCAAIAIGQPDAALAQDEGQLASKEDKSGTNPINFQNEFRFNNEYQDFGNGNTGNVTTLEYRTPFAGGKWQYRFRVPYRSLDVTAGGTTIDESGLGDINMRVLTVPYLNTENATAVAVGLEVWFPTASPGVLGTDAVVLGPQIFFAKFNPFGIPKSGIFPGYQHAFSVGGNDDVNESRFDLFVLKQWPEQQMYMMLNPQYVVDWENDTEGGVFDAELGYVFKSGVSIYGRPGAGFGGDKPLDWNFEAGVKKVW